MINQYMAQKFWKTPQEAIGKRFRFGSATDTSRRWVTIVGVAPDIKHKQLTQQPDLPGYMPFRQGGWSSSAIVVRTRGEPTQATSTVLSAIKQSDPLLPAYRVLSMDANIPRLIVGHGAVLGGVGIGIGLIGALASYIPARRAARVDPVEALRYD